MTNSHHHDPEPIPRALLIGAGAMIAISLLVTSIASFTNLGVQNKVDESFIESIALKFEDKDDGGISVFDHHTGELVWTYEPETGGFIRTAMRAIVYIRKKQGIGSEEPFVLGRTAEGRLLLTDPQTNRLIGLDAFGKTNADDFAQIFSARKLAG